jgi:lipopolysaccharide/colanic/teichoic acid biosynthesis glycosyltransferase
MHCFVLLLIDLLIIFASTACAIALTTGLHLPIAAPPQELLYGLLTLVLAAPMLLAAGLNRTLWRFTSLQDCLRILIALTVTLLAATTIVKTFSSMESVPISLPALQFVLMAGALIGARAFTRIRRSRRIQRQNAKAPVQGAREEILVIGISSVAELFLRCVNESGGTRVAVAGILSEKPRHRGRLLRSYPILGRPDELLHILHELEIHGIHIRRIAIAVPFHMLSSIAQNTVLKVARDLEVRIDILHERFGLDEATASHSMSSVLAATEKFRDVEPIEIPAIQHAQRSYPRWKRLFDIALATVAATCLAPLAIVMAAIVLVDVGYPFIFWQQRPGARGKPIRVLKFRTMRSARSVEGRLLSDAERLSAIGRFLRRTRADELPQIINVLLGDMSIIGPRPLLPIDQSPRFVARLEMRPGLTGWAQVNGGRHLTIQDKAALDLWYVMNASFQLDFRILLLTARTIVFGECINQNAIREAWSALGLTPSATVDASKRVKTAAETEPETEPRRIGWYHPSPLAVAIPASDNTQVG